MRMSNSNKASNLSLMSNLQGFNTGVVLYDLERMREVNLVDKIISEEVYKNLTNKYMFLGSVGDQVN